MVMKFKSVLDIACGIRYIYSKLDICSSLSRAILLDSEMSTKIHDIEKAYDNINEVLPLLSKPTFASAINLIKIKLSELKDIRSSVIRLKEGAILDDIELFEIKSLAIINNDISSLLSQFNTESIKIYDTTQVLNLLDPDGNRITSFYLYDSYSPELTKLRRDYKQSNYQDQEITFEISKYEEIIREQLSSSLREHYLLIDNTMLSLARADILIAKCLQIKNLGLIVPNVSLNNKTEYRGLFNPEIESILKNEKREYQKTDISFCSEIPLLITGSNMGGKTVTLKTLALSQLLFQFGFGIPATEALITPVSEIYLSCGDDQDYRVGLSSFAAEMKRVDKMIKSLRRGRFILSLTDEPARTTNPVEGSALAEALITILSKYRSMNILTTHYNISNPSCSRLRVKGFENGKMNYSLVEDTGTEAPHEALLIAESLEIDPEWVELAQKELNKRN
ncbi:MAG: hypothetical protein CVU11_03020 [Bacteroidetes bacterium HGW-Bacteroidetes-6]|jgi:dsDNA-specific endonuclease/ATPase MutS2|nr:MAG: hypothetical protein CVU12_04755 [Bacteroidetes bacterium HGW-Bacteroidetes-7]PKP04892.1 MAG: hypothetical protein CVU11_03020 [Bacteroidetes bacterium HGW-Bacteroidetes-6]